MKNYYLPGFLENQHMYKIFLFFKEHHPECFYDNVNISKIYGIFPGCIWNGGSAWYGGGFTRSLIQDTFGWYKEKGVQLQLTCTNPILEERDMYDRLGNAILEEACNFQNVEVLVSNDIMEKHIRENYPTLPVDKSIIATTRDREILLPEDYIKLADEYNMVVFPRKYSKDWEFLNQIPQDKRNKFEILCTDPCSIHCPRLYTHYEDLGKSQLFLPCENTLECTSFHPNNPFKEKTYQKKYQISVEELAQYEEAGYSEFKISGRIHLAMAILRVVPYLIKPEYQLDIMLQMFDYVKEVDCPPDFS